MNTVFTNLRVEIQGKFTKGEVLVKDDTMQVGTAFDHKKAVVLDCKEQYLFPGLVDVHVHFREPGFLHKETIKTGSLAAARGGYTTVCTMPNLSPAPDRLANLQPQLDAIQKDAIVQILPYGTITVAEQGKILSDMQALAPYVVAFSDDGCGVADDNMMREAMLQAKDLDKMIVAHCEDMKLRNNGYIHDGEYAKAHGHRGISSESEWRPLARDLALVKETKCAYHMCHISTKESVELIRQAKRDGLNVSCETAPHYLILDDSCLQEDGRFKMNPPLRSKQDREALLEGVYDGTIDMIATDHAPHTQEEKTRGLKDSAMGIVGLETAFALLYTHLVKKNLISLEKLVSMMSTIPAERFGIDRKNQADLTLFDLQEQYTITAEEFLSKGKSSPFLGKKVFGRCKGTMRKGEWIWREK